MQAGTSRMLKALRNLEAAFLVGVEGTTEIWLVRTLMPISTARMSLIQRLARPVVSRLHGWLSV